MNIILMIPLLITNVLILIENICIIIINNIIIIDINYYIIIHIFSIRTTFLLQNRPDIVFAIDNKKRYRKKLNILIMLSVGLFFCKYDVPIKCNCIFFINWMV